MSHTTDAHDTPLKALACEGRADLSLALRWPDPGPLPSRPPAVHASPAAMEKVSLLRTCLCVIVTAIVLSYSSYVLLSPDLITDLTQEDGFFENATAAFFFAAFLGFLACSIKYRNGFLLLLAIAFFFACGEEISWGQRIIGFETPAAIEAANVQGEFNLHNLELFSGRNLDKSPRQGIERLLTISLLYQAFWLAYAILLPIAVRTISPVESFLRNWRFPVPPLAIGIFFLVSWGAHRVLLSSIDPALPDALNEIRECISALVFLVLSVWFFKRGRQAGLHKSGHAHA